MYKSFKEMPVWQDAMEIAVIIFTMTDHLPKKEDYGFTSQVRRSALSISANISEAFGRNHIADKINFYYLHEDRQPKLKAIWNTDFVLNILMKLL